MSNPKRVANARRAGPRKHPTFLPQLENLEDRRLLAAGISLVDGAIVVTGSDGDDYAYVNTDDLGGALTYRVYLKTPSGRDTQWFLQSEVTNKNIKFYGNKGNDTFTNNISWSSVQRGIPDLTVLAWGGAGRDALAGGSLNDVLKGDAGVDSLGGKGGDDFLWGGADDDTLMGDAGNDTLIGEAGADKLKGGDDHDLLLGGFVNGTADNRRDSLWGGSGDDTFAIEWYYDNYYRTWFNRDYPLDYANDWRGHDDYLNPTPPARP